MCEKDICKILDEKFDEFLQKIDDLTLRDELRKSLYFAGGCIYCLWNDKPVKDYDLFLQDDKLIEPLKKLSIWGYTSEYALTLGKFQVITKYFGSPDECVGQFDFMHNMHYYVPGTNKIHSAWFDEFFDYESDYFKYLDTNELHFNESRARDIEGVWLRIEKFVNRGMTISRKTKAKIKRRTTRRAINKYKKARRKNSSYY